MVQPNNLLETGGRTIGVVAAAPIVLLTFGVAAAEFELLDTGVYGTPPGNELIGLSPVFRNFLKLRMVD